MASETILGEPSERSIVPPDALPSPLIVVLGPTGAGKSELSLQLASELNAEIVNCDSIQVYRELHIGAAKVPPEKRRGIPHHLIDTIALDQELTAGAYSRLARQTITAIQRRGRVPIVVGGTGFYLRALLDGLSSAPERNEAVRARLSDLAARRPGALHRFLRRHDPAAATRIHPNDRQKLIRASEMMMLACQPVSTTQSLPRNAISGSRTLKIGLLPDRTLLQRRLDKRSAWMFDHGLLEETRELLDSGVPAEGKPLQSLGYKQAVKALSGEWSLACAIRDCQAKTRQYAKRQITWFRREPAVEWLAGFGEEAQIQDRALQLARAFLADF